VGAGRNDPSTYKTTRNEFRPTWLRPSNVRPRYVESFASVRLESLTYTQEIRYAYFVRSRVQTTGTRQEPSPRDVCILTGVSHSFLSIENTFSGAIFVEALPRQSAERGGARTALECGSGVGSGTAVVVWEEEPLSVTTADVMAPGGGWVERKRDQDVAGEWLLTALDGGRIASGDLFRTRRG
jgi:hypothetical protein